jgi:poly(3-hydroxybutyrate) depolymerase
MRYKWLMTLLTGQELAGNVRRTYHTEVPADPIRATLPLILVFHGGGQDATTIAKRWSVDPPNPVPPELSQYLLVFPESDPLLPDEWVHFKAGDSAFPTHDLEFVGRLLTELTTRAFPTGSATVPTVSGDPDLVYAAGFSNGGGMVWQLLNSSLVDSFRGFAAVGAALDPEKVQHFRSQLAAVGAVPAPVPVVYVHGTADRTYRPTVSQEETSLEETLPFFTVREMLSRNGVLVGTAGSTQLVAGTAGVTEVVLQLFEGSEAFLQVTVINGGHNWPMATTVGNPPVADHFDATITIVDFWHRHAGLP